MTSTSTDTVEMKVRLLGLHLTKSSRVSGVHDCSKAPQTGRYNNSLQQRLQGQVWRQVGSVLNVHIGKFDIGKVEVLGCRSGVAVPQTRCRQGRRSSHRASSCCALRGGRSTCRSSSAGTGWHTCDTLCIAATKRQQGIVAHGNDCMPRYYAQVSSAELQSCRK
jgi:hypothetical protein